jgi:hypothetical protein
VGKSYSYEDEEHLLATLDEVKQFAEKFLNIQLEMMRMISTLSIDDVNEFNHWYVTNPYYMDLQKLVAITQRK